MLKGILAISGQQGLFKLIAEAKNNIIVESLETGKRMPAYSTAKVSTLEDIAIYTHSGDVPLKDVFKIIFDSENGGEALSPKSPDEKLKSYFKKVLPDYDADRVYISDIKKVLLWYNTLLKKDMLVFAEEEAKEEKPEEESKEENSGQEQV